jgi:hypothetical protein
MAPDRGPQVGNMAEISILLVQRCVTHVRLTVYATIDGVFGRNGSDAELRGVVMFAHIDVISTQFVAGMWILAAIPLVIALR